MTFCSLKVSSQFSEARIHGYNSDGKMTDKQYQEKDKMLLEEIEGWISSNRLVDDPHYVWRVGISCDEEISDIANKVRSDFECKHFKTWQAGSFKGAMMLIRNLTKYSYILKSPLNEYADKGEYVFIYKTLSPSQNLFRHTLHY